MAVQGAAKRYAEAVFDIASGQQEYDRWLGDLRVLADVAGDDESRSFFENPAISDEAKSNALAQLLPGEQQAEARNLAQMLVHRGRFDQLPGLLEAFEDMVLAERGIAIANVTTAIELTDAEQQMVRDGLQRAVGRDIEIRPTVDPEIIGGIVARIGDRLIDGSVRSQLRQMHIALVRR